MSTEVLDSLAALYEADETAWLDAMACLIREGRVEELDYAHLTEYLEDMAARDRREVKSRLSLLLAHLLKWNHQPDRRSNSWRATIHVQQRDLADLLGRTILRKHAEQVFAAAYAAAVEFAAIETGLPAESFPLGCPYTLDEILNPGERFQ